MRYRAESVLIVGSLLLAAVSLIMFCLSISEAQAIVPTVPFCVKNVTVARPMQRTDHGWRKPTVLKPSTKARTALNGQ
jgi:hypothetical protein